MSVRDPEVITNAVTVLFIADLVSRCGSILVYVAGGMSSSKQMQVAREEGSGKQNG